MSRSGEVDVVEVEPTHGVVVWNDACFILFGNGANEALFASMSEAFAGVVARHGHCAAIVVMESKLPQLFSAKARTEARATLDRVASGFSALAVYTPSAPLYASLTRTTLRMMTTLLSLDFEWEVFSKQDELADWVGPRLVGRPDAAHLLDVLDHVRGLLRSEDKAA